MNAARDARVIHGARVWSEGRVLPHADAVAIVNGRIVAVGLARDVLAGWPGAEMIDAAGATLTPGMVDAHVHLLAWARSRRELSLFGAASAAEIARRLAAHAARHPGAESIVARGWDDHGWSAPPHREALDAVCASRPVLLHSHDYHALWLNGAALDCAGIGPATPDPPGGKLERDAAGRPTGVLREHAVRLAAPVLPAPDDARDRAALEQAIAELHALGITGVHVFEGARARRLLRAASRDDRLGLRVLMNVPHESLEAAIRSGVKSGAGDRFFRIGAVKLFSDGTLGSRTAALHAPYHGTASTGMDLIAPAELERLVSRAAEAGLATAIHAIGDRAVSSSLDAFAACSEARRGVALPGRIEHVQLAETPDLSRFASLGVAASLQPTHATSDIAAAERWWPDRLDRAYPWASLLEQGAVLAFGSDAPVEPPSAALTLHAAVTRERVDGSPAGGWTPRERVSLDAALTACTEGPARLAGTWPDLGRIAPGSEADLVLWDRDLHATPAATLHEARPRVTLLAGRTVHAAGAAEPQRASGAAA